MSLDQWPPNNLCSLATKWGLSIVSGSQLQVAKLAQMCPAVPRGAQRYPGLLRDAHRCQPNGAHTNGAHHNGVHPNGAHPNGAHSNGVHLIVPTLLVPTLTVPTLMMPTLMVPTLMVPTNGAQQRCRHVLIQYFRNKLDRAKFRLPTRPRLKLCPQWSM